MPPIPGIPNLIQLLIKGKWLTGENTVDSLHLSTSNPGPYTSGDLQSLAAQTVTVWTSSMLPVQSQDWSLVGCVAIDRTVADGHQGEAPAAAAGTKTDDPLPLNTSVLMQWEDTVHYRGGHARTYVPGAVVTDTTNGRDLTTAAHTAWNTAWSSFLTQVLGDGPYGIISPLTWAAAHYRRMDAPLVTPFLSPIVPLGPALQMATQRRRLRKAAHH